MHNRNFLVLLIPIFFLCLAGCDKKFSNPVAVSNAVYPDAPTNLTAQVNDGCIRLSWNQSASSEIDLYHIFRADSIETNLVLIDSSSQTSFVDTDVINGMFYTYRISAINTNGYEGPLSRMVVAKPGINSILINGGAEYTNSETITLTLVGSESIDFMQINDDSAFPGSSWEPFSATRIWTLSQGDGVKTIYARFRDDEGNHICSVF